MEELIAQILAYVSGLGEGWAVTAAVFVAVCAALAATLKAPGENASVWWRVLYGLINMIGMNVGRARNHDDAKAAEKKAAKTEAEAKAPDKLG